MFDSYLHDNPVCEGKNLCMFIIILDLFQFAIVWGHLLGHMGNLIHITESQNC